MGRIFARIEFKDTREESAKEKIQLLIFYRHLIRLKKNEAANMNFFNIHP